MIKLHAATLDGLFAKPVDVECAFHKGLPAFSIVGLADSSIQESKERVKAALGANGFVFPPLKVTVGLFPSDMPKAGSHFDLAIALSIALQDAQITKRLDDFFILGELGLGGALRNSAAIFPLVLSLVGKRLARKIIAPLESVEFLNKIPDIEIYAAATLKQAIDFIKGEIEIAPVFQENINSLKLTVNNNTYFFHRDFELDFSQVKGQKIAKRAALISAVGFHNLLLEGSPGCGKSMIIKRLRYILPPMSLEELLDTSTREFLDGGKPDFAPIRPFRSPHHTATKAAIFGGGSREGKIGEVALANKGILYFDELPHFEKSTLEALREPLEDNRLLVSRVNSKIEYETDFLFAAAQNPCPCGNLLSQIKTCRCTQAEITKYKNKLSEPFLDRIDIFIQMDEPKPDECDDINSQELFEQVLKAFKFRLERNQNVPNGKLSEADIASLEFSSAANDVLNQAADRFGMSMRSLAKIKKVARTLADLSQDAIIQKAHILEALSYRKR